MKKYIYIFEDGTIKTGPEPEIEDFDSVEGGILDILDPEELKFHTGSEGWENIPDMEDE